MCYLTYSLCQSYEMGTISILVLQMRKLRCRKIKKLAKIIQLVSGIISDPLLRLMGSKDTEKKDIL